MPILEEMLLCQREIGNTHDPFAVKVTKSGNIVGHLPKNKLNMFVISEERGCSCVPVPHSFQ